MLVQGCGSTIRGRRAGFLVLWERGGGRGKRGGRHAPDEEAQDVELIHDFSGPVCCQNRHESKQKPHHAILSNPRDNPSVKSKSSLPAFPLITSPSTRNVIGETHRGSQRLCHVSETRGRSGMVPGMARPAECLVDSAGVRTTYDPRCGSTAGTSLHQQSHSGRRQSDRTPWATTWKGKRQGIVRIPYTRWKERHPSNAQHFLPPLLSKQGILQGPDTSVESKLAFKGLTVVGKRGGWGQTCRMRVPMVIWPCWELLALVSSKHLTTMEVLDIDTCASPGPIT